MRKKEKKAKKRKKKEEKKSKGSAAVLCPGGSGSPVVRMSGFGDRLRDAGLDPEQLQGLNDDEAQEQQDTLLESLAALQARRAKARSAEPKEPPKAAPKTEEKEERNSKEKPRRLEPKPKDKGEGQHGCFARCAGQDLSLWDLRRDPPPPKKAVSGSARPAEPAKPPSARARAALPTPKVAGTQAVGVRPPVPGSAPATEGKGQRERAITD